MNNNEPGTSGKGAEADEILVLKATISRLQAEHAEAIVARDSRILSLEKRIDIEGRLFKGIESLKETGRPPQGGFWRRLMGR